MILPAKFAGFCFWSYGFAFGDLAHLAILPENRRRPNLRG